jgi:hypothetical protein
VGDADPAGDGKVTESCELCNRCHRALTDWLKKNPFTPPPNQKVRKP